MKVRTDKHLPLTGLIPFIAFVATLSLYPSSAAGVCLDGFVRDRSGAPVVRADLDFDNALTGQRLFTPGDNTDINGQYSVCVLPGIYHVSFAPPPGSHLVGLRLYDVSLFSNTLLDVTLDSGFVITGTVTDTSGLPIGRVNLAVDSLGAGRVYTPGDKTDTINGVYRIVVPPHDRYRIRFEPPAGMNLQVGQIDSISIQSDTVINFVLVPGIALSGSVQETSGAPVSLTKLSLKRTIDGVKVPLANNKTDSLGKFLVIAPPGQFSLQFAPPSGRPLIGVAFDSLTLATDTIINVTLAPGVAVTATITDIDGTPLEHADIDVTRESDLIRLYTPHDKTDANGVATVVVPPDVYEFKADPPLGRLLDKSVVRNISITLDTTLTFVLNPLNRVAVTGRIVDRQGMGIPGITIGATILPGRLPGKVKRPLSDSAGFFDAAVPIGTIDLLFSPARGSRFTGKRLANMTLFQDSTLGIIQLDTGVVMTAHIVTQDGEPASGFDLSLLTNGNELFTPHDSVDVFGKVIVTAPPGSYDISISPPSGVSGDSLSLTNVTLNRDTVITLVLGSSSLNPMTFILRQNYPNPFNGTTQIPYLLNVSARVVLSIHNVLGQVVRRYDLGEQMSGYYTPEWDGSDNNGAPVASGVYFYRLQTSKQEVTRKMLFIQ